jgi:SH3-like domain-containing protein
VKFYLSQFVIVYSIFASMPAPALCVSSFQARLRANPSLSAKVTWVVGRHMPLLEINRKGAWIQVQDVDGVNHWISSQDVSAQARCVVVRVERAALRQGPNVKAPLAVIENADKYTAFKRLEAEPEQWYFVEDEAGGKYWINAAQVWRATKVNKIGF